MSWNHRNADLVQLPAQSGIIANTNLLVNFFFSFKFKLSLPSCNFCCLPLALLSAATKTCLAPRQCNSRSCPIVSVAGSSNLALTLPTLSTTDFGTITVHLNKKSLFHQIIQLQKYFNIFLQQHICMHTHT